MAAFSNPEQLSLIYTHWDGKRLSFTVPSDLNESSSFGPHWKGNATFNILIKSECGSTRCPFCFPLDAFHFMLRHQIKSNCMIRNLVRFVAFSTTLPEDSLSSRNIPTMEFNQLVQRRVIWVAFYDARSTCSRTFWFEKFKYPLTT